MEKDTHVILLVEDSDEDYYATKRAFEKVGIANALLRCVDGEDALNYLYHKEKYENKENFPIPNLILLDLNLPKKDGREVLETIKKDKKLNEIPVIVLTTSSDTRDIDLCYASGANSYIQKPVKFENFIKAVQKLKDYWFEIVVFPKIEN